MYRTYVPILDSACFDSWEDLEDQERQKRRKGWPYLFQTRQLLCLTMVPVTIASTCTCAKQTLPAVRGRTTFNLFLPCRPCIFERLKRIQSLSGEDQ